MEFVHKSKLLKNILGCITEHRNVLLHGPGGCGKSWSLRKIAKALEEMEYNVFITALTGVAALNLSTPEERLNATTLHRYAGIGTAQLSARALASRVASNFPAKQRWKTADVIIIDEVSMMGAGLIEKLDYIAKYIREDESPFGGIVVVFSGDFLQLPPVKDDWIYKSEAWKNIDIRPFIFKKPYRYDDQKFFEMLLRIREGKHTEADVKLLRSRVVANKKLQKLLKELESEKPGEVIKPTMLFSKRMDVDVFNQRELDALPGESVEFVARDAILKLKGSPKLDDYTTLLDEFAPRSIQLKVGAQVMLRINVSVDQGLVNGSRGVVCEIIDKEAIVVKFLNGEQVRFEAVKREVEDKYAVASRTQIPFILAWSSTIHKVQGSTLDYVIVDLGPSVFAEGQAVVALGRCRNIKGLFLSEFTPESILTSQESLEYSQSLEKLAEKEDSKA